MATDCPVVQTRGSFEPLVMSDAHVTLEPLVPAHAAELAAAVDVDRSTFDYTWVPTPEGAHEWLDGILHQQASGIRMPFAVRHNASGALVGSTSYWYPSWFDWPNAEHGPDTVEVGGTWYVPSAQRTAVNTACKRLLLGHAFETWRVVRLAMLTDARNERSRRAMERLGARFEGVLRSDRLAADGKGPRDTALFSITSEEWPAVRERLDASLGSGDGHT
jgi:N-acetyltransferase